MISHDANLLKRKVDTINLDDIFLFAYKEDNLYRLAVLNEHKNVDLLAYNKRVADKGYSLSPIQQNNYLETKNSRYCSHYVLAHLIQHYESLSVLDIGAWIGDFSLKMANVIRTSQANGHVYAFDPTEAGYLIPSNIRLNGLQSYVTHVPKAVAPHPGIVMFRVDPSSSDASSLPSKAEHYFNLWGLLKFFLKTNRKSALLWKALGYLTRRRSDYNILAEAVDLESWTTEAKLGEICMIKLDIEGIDHLIISDIVTRRIFPNLPVVIMEFNPYAYSDFDHASDHLRRLSESFQIHDIWYSPGPACCRRISTDTVRDFVVDVAKRIFNYTDVMLIPHELRGAESLASGLTKLEENPREYVMY